MNATRVAISYERMSDDFGASAFPDAAFKCNIMPHSASEMSPHEIWDV